MTGSEGGAADSHALTSARYRHSGNFSADIEAFSPSPSMPFVCVPHLLEHWARRIPNAPAILTPGRVPLNYCSLHQHIEEIGEKLREMGIARRDRVAVVLPNGPEMAVAFLSVAASAVCAPLNPAYAVEELERYFADLHPRALITQAGIDSPARRAALSRRVRIIELSTAPEAEAGLFTLAGDKGRPVADEPIGAADTALLLPTSGTTSRPKLVTLTHRNICTSAYASVAALALTRADRCLNVLPLFYGHGLIATVLTSLAAGASVVCCPGLDVTSFVAWLSAFRPTWCAAVPAMLQAILAQARLTGERIVDPPLRFVRTASAPLPRRVLTELERIFAAPVINFYGMTETASAPIAIIPLPPLQRKSGSVGLPMALDVAIMDDRDILLSTGQTGEIIVRGASVTPGYDGNKRASKAAFAGDWFKTGDLGHFDDDGYLFLTGRTREMINRGGEKIAPQEVDEALHDHPAVAEAVTFAVPHATLGEDVVSAVVLRPNAKVTPKDIRQFAAGRIAEFKVPRQVLIVSEIPKGPTGKVQRVSLAVKLGLTNSAGLTQTFVAPRTPIEKVLAGIWAEVLEVEQIGVHDDFFALGGDSLQAGRVLVRLQQSMQIGVAVSAVFEAPTIAEMAEYIETVVERNQTQRALSTDLRAPRENGIAPASTAQDRLCKLQEVAPDLLFFNILYALRVRSACVPAVLERSINEIVRRHEILRTTFAIRDGRRVQVIAPHLTIPLISDDLRGFSDSKAQSATRRIVQEELVHSFDVAKGPLIRTRLLRVVDEEYVLLISMHRAICDGWSLGVFVQELATLYDAFAAARQSPLAPLAIQYADFADWQRRWRSYPQIVAQLAYWREQLHDPLPMMRFATPHPKRKPADFRTARRQATVPAKLLQSAKRFAQREGLTLFMVLAAAFKTLLHRYTGENDLRMATHVANRNRPGTEGLIGPLANTVILRTSLAGDPSSREVIHRVRAITLAAFANQEVAFAEVVETLEGERRLERASLAQVMMWLQNSTLRPIAVCSPGLALEEAIPSMPLPLVTITSFDVILMLRESTQGLLGSCVYKRHLFGVKEIDCLLRDFRRVLKHMIMQPEQLISAIPVSLK
jgi:acyl-CoA synthetase (AMP-forming)/AMP-acid ligase II/acyl carrier protein